MSRRPERIRKLEEWAEAKRQSERLKIDWSEVDAELLRKFDEFLRAHERGGPVEEIAMPLSPEAEKLLRKLATFAPGPDGQNEEQGL